MRLVLACLLVMVLLLPARARAARWDAATAAGPAGGVGVPPDRPYVLHRPAGSGIDLDQAAADLEAGYRRTSLYLGGDCPDRIQAYLVTDAGLLEAVRGGAAIAHVVPLGVVVLGLAAPPVLGGRLWRRPRGGGRAR